MTAPTYDLRRGDALAVLRDLPDASVHAVITDPPYSSGGMVRSDRLLDVRLKYIVNQKQNTDHDTFSGDTRDGFGYWFWCSMWLAEASRVAVPGAVCALFTDWRQLPITVGALQAGGWVYRGLMPWHKPNARPVQGRFTNACEYVAWGTNGPRALDAIGPVALPGLITATVPTGDDRMHMTQKPLDVMRPLVKIAPKGGVVLDPFMGSGTTGVAALIEGRDFVGVELTEHYFETAEHRIGTAAQGYKDDAAQMVLGVEEAS